MENARLRAFGPAIQCVAQGIFTRGILIAGSDSNPYFPSSDAEAGDP